MRNRVKERQAKSLASYVPITPIWSRNLFPPLGLSRYMQIVASECAKNLDFQSKFQLYNLINEVNVTSNVSELPKTVFLNFFISA